MNPDAAPHSGDTAEATAGGADAPISPAQPRGRRSLLRAALAGTAVVGGGLAVEPGADALSLLPNHTYRSQNEFRT
ncbi:hypothetical protein PV369_41740, partial [Streptomyces scabiei]|nr:hypothetical protein [Streptomyces scabiei]